MFELMDAYSQSAVIKVIRRGRRRRQRRLHMVASGIDGVDFMCINTDAQALKHSKVKTALQIGCNITKGLGAGADPEVGRQAAMEDRDHHRARRRLRHALHHRRHGRRHGHRGGAGRGADRQGTRHLDGGGGDQALSRWKAASAR